MNIKTCYKLLKRKKCITNFGPWPVPVASELFYYPIKDIFEVSYSVLSIAMKFDRYFFKCNLKMKYGNKYKTIFFICATLHKRYPLTFIIH